MLIDTNVLIAATVGEPERGAVARDLLDEDHAFATTLLNVMEFRTVLTKKKQFEQEKVEDLVDGIFDRMDVYGPETGDLIQAYKRQRDTLLYTMDCVILATADAVDAQLVTFDAELREHGAISPEELLE